jgi:CHRD domain
MLTISRRLVLPACVLGLALWSATSSAAPESFQVQLSGSQQSPPVQTGGSGTADLTYNPSTRMLQWSISYSGLSGPVTMAHLHGPAAAGKDAGVQVWLTKKGSPVESPITGEAKLTAAQARMLREGELYINVHTKANPKGEIRGQVVLPKG